ncbi:MAG TPA: phosphate ABC transporter substrate-binding protein PstS [Gammaproteobacteria bacterium]|nr:phosphate ABC transporter substrate-binding protein PstS [Gammaproteobacteria bacterium]
MTRLVNRSAALLLALAAGGAGQAAPAFDISGAGATFPYPVYAKWAEAYMRQTGVRVNYQPIGSGGGIKQVQAGTVTFGATDKPLQSAELDASGLVQWPMIVGGVVPVANVKGVKPGELVLDGATLAAIYLGEIKKWNDARIKKLNPGLELPNQFVAPVYRSDGSGTNFLFTSYLSSASPEFNAKVGANTSVAWPVGFGSKGNEGVANMAGRTAGAIGYVEYAFVKQTGMPYARLVNRDGNTVAPSIAAFQAAAANADWSSANHYSLVLVDQPGAESWPITGASFILIRRHAKNAGEALAALEFFDWAYREGDQLAIELDYVPLPDNVVALVRQTWSEEITASGKPVWNR